MTKIPKPKVFDIDDHFPKDMSFETLLLELGLNRRDVIVTLINPLRKDEYYKQGKLTGFKSGIWGGGGSKYKNGMARSYDSTKRRWIKKPKVHVTYNIYVWGKGHISDWVDVDNCKFSVIKK